jgi:hypothetical protein
MKNVLIFLATVTTLCSIGAIAIWLSSEPSNPPSVVGPPKVSPPIDVGTPIPEPKEYTLEEAIQAIDRPELEKDLRYLASDELEGRMSGKKGNVLAAKYIKDKFESFGLKTMYHKFKINRVNPGPKNEAGDSFTQNIYGWLEGNDPALKDEIVVVGAHMDHIGYGPSMSRSPRRREVHHGADDNASGTVALMQIAEACSMLKGKNKRTIVFQAYSAEEMGLIGARFYCNNPIFPLDNPSIRKHVAMINMDMVGYLNKGVYFAGFHAGDSSIDLGRIINDLNNKYSFARKITSRGSGGSDHACFYNKRVPVAFLHTGGHPYYHTPDDTADRINFDGIEKVARYAFELSWRVCQAEARLVFNHEDFKPMEYVHDHGHKGVPFIHSYHEHLFEDKDGKFHHQHGSGDSHSHRPSNEADRQPINHGRNQE